MRQRFLLFTGLLSLWHGMASSKSDLGIDYLAQHRENPSHALTLLHPLPHLHAIHRGERMMIQCQCITIPGKKHPAMAECWLNHSEGRIPYRLCAFSRDVINFCSTTFQGHAGQMRPVRTQHGAACHLYACRGHVLVLYMLHPSGADAPLPRLCGNRILLGLASRRYFQVPSMERISDGKKWTVQVKGLLLVSQQEAGVVTHIFTPAPFFPHLKKNG